MNTTEYAAACDLAANALAELDALAVMADPVNAGRSQYHPDPEWWHGYRSAIADLRAGVLRWHERAGRAHHHAPLPPPLEWPRYR